MHVRAYAEADSERWDALVWSAPMGTMLHTRRFLDYHGERFVDRSLLAERADGTLAAVLPAAVDLHDPLCVVSHPGATYGGLLFDDDLLGPADVAAIIDDMRQVLRGLGHRTLRYKPVPPHIPAHPCQLDLHLLWQRGGKVVRRDLWNVVGVGADRRVHRSRELSARRAASQAVTVARESTSSAYAEFFVMVETTLATRHGVAPVHSLAELGDLARRFPDRITLWLARDGGGAAVAGEWLFDLRDGVTHLQYSAATVDGRRVGAVDLLRLATMTEVERRQARCYSLGASTDATGTLNGGLYAHKARFGAGVVVADVYEVAV